MSQRSRDLGGALIGCILALSFASPGWGQALDSTPRITRNTCPAPHCNLGMWQSGAGVPVFAAPGAGKPAFSLRPRVPFEALGGETHAIPGVHVLRTRLDVFDERATSALAPGDTIRTLAYLGEGRFSLEARGRAWLALMDERDAARFQTVRPIRETWWVEVKAPDGRRGWIDGGNPDIAGRTFDEATQPLSPAVLDGEFLAGLTGPVSAIVRERGSTKLTPFESPVEGARGGEGAAWWTAGSPRLLQLRFRTLLTAAGTTNPEHSGLPAGAVVCCGDLLYHRLMVFTRRDPEYVATITIPDRGDRHVVEAFFQRGRLVRLLRDARAVPIAYADSVMGRAWYSAARALLEEVTTKPTVATAGGAAQSDRAASAAGSFLARKGLVRTGAAAVVLLLAAAAAWWWQRRRAQAPAKRAARLSAAEEVARQAAAAAEEGWVCPYCHADVLLDLDECWLCGRRRPAEPSQAPAVSMCGCGEPNPPDARSCRRCGKILRVRVL